ncbi:GNAT family N-acetyltransferase [Enterococcus saccharolyticus]|uniref:Acetyltransferase n=1 Tax=Candidatus Enterococcus willemsii TaxID=1857215 RepID=A0ABQ6Z0D5_9ENTE|nr:MULTISPECIES: GNAT family N-acetyltransferase [Enterococcus]KAF1304438.1 acetyltransferase [Enterococcus sp. CU12B]MCD5002190.1 GNAT family N-acetyltransferase [Enterococcus saccharolyticus]
METPLVLAENNRIETERLVLRPVTLADAQDMYEYASDEETTTFVFPRHQSLAETRQAIAEFFMAAPLGKFAIEYKENHKMIGTIDLRVNPDSTAELGYTINKAYWGRGLVPEAARALLALGFEQLDLVRIFAIHEVENPNSGRVMEKIGMSKESTVYEAKKMRDRVVNIVRYSVSKKEWSEQR